MVSFQLLLQAGCTVEQGARQVKRDGAAPGSPRVVTSGYSADGPGATMIAAGARGYVAKPFRVQTLLAAIRGAVDARA
jgi:DNA-binding NarL/FixJ family response regulator